MKGFNNLPSFGEEKAESTISSKQSIEHSKSFSTLANSESRSGAEPSPSPFSLSKHSHSGKSERTKGETEKASKERGLKKLRKRPEIPSAKYPFHRISPAVTNTLPSKDIIIKNAPNPTKQPKMNWLSVFATPVVMVIGVVLMAFLMGTSLLTYLIMFMMAASSAVVSVINYRSQKKDITQSQDELNGKYLSYLASVEKEIVDVVKKQQHILNTANPSVRVCASLNENSNELWNRSENSKQFMCVRLGVGEAPLCIHVKAPEKSYDRDIPLEDRARAIAENSSMVSNIPVTFDLRTHPSMGIVGERENVVSQAISVIINTTALHSYEALKLVVVYPKEEQSIWEDIRWLPHVYDDKRQVRYVASSTADCKVLLSEFTKTIEERANSSSKSPWTNTRATPHYLVVIADVNCIKGSAISHFLTLNDPALSISTLFLAPDIRSLPNKCQSIVETSGDHASVYLASAFDKKIEYIPDRVENKQFSDYCHTMAPIRIDGATSSKEVPSFFTFLNAWGVTRPEELAIADYWRNSLPSESMQVPLGAAAEGVIFSFDDHQDAHGVHGMYVGTNGSGKSSMVRSWVLSMAVRFSPEFVNFVLVDFKGSGLLDGLEKLPHVVGTISNLDSDLRRNLIALESEIERREAFFKETGGNIYSCYKAGNTSMPFLFVVIDELAEFKIKFISGVDNKMELLNRLAQVGRALGIHLIAGSQTTAPFTDTMEKNARFRWCLKTATAEDSMYLLKTDDAFNITEKGRAIVRVGSNEVYEEIQPIFSDCLYYSPEELDSMPERNMALLNQQGIQTKVRIEDDPDKITQLDAVVSRICKVANAMHIVAPRKIWPDRLPSKVYLEDLASPKEGELKVAVGLVDDPKGQCQYTLQIDLYKNGHVVLYGAPRTGKTTFLMTAALSLLAHCNPNQVEVYMIGNSLKPLWDCPQVIKGVDHFAPKPVISAVYNELIRRKKNGMTPSDSPIALFIDGIGELMFDFKTELVNLAQFGAGCRIFLVASAAKQGDVASISAYLTRGYALWFADSKYEYQTALAEKNVDCIPSKEIPGRGIFYDGRTMEFQTAIPCKSKTDLDNIIQHIIDRNRIYKKAPIAKKKEAGEAVIGIGCDSNCEVTHNFREQSSLLVLGDDSAKREHTVCEIAKQLASQPDVYQLVGIDLDYGAYAMVSGIHHLQSGTEVDAFLEGMYNEVKRRNDLQKTSERTEFPKCIFVINDWEKCVNNISEMSHKRFAINILQKGKILGIQLITATSYAAFANRFENDNIGATQLLGVGCSTFLNYSGQHLPSCFAAQRERFGSTQGSFYVTPDRVEQIEVPV